MLRVTCSCGKSSKTEDGNAGRRAKCPNCGGVIVFPPLPPAVTTDTAKGDRVEVQYEPHHPVPAQRPAAPPDIPFVSHSIQVAPKMRGVNAFVFGAFVFGILGLSICWIPLLNLLVIPLAGIGIVLALVGLMTSLLGGRSGVGWPVTGLVLCVIASVATFLVSLVTAGVLVAAGKSLGAADTRVAIAPPPKNSAGDGRRPEADPALAEPGSGERPLSTPPGETVKAPAEIAETDMQPASLVSDVGAPKVAGETQGQSGRYTPPTMPRTEAQYGRIYRLIRETSTEAGRYADRAFPQSAPRFDRTEAERRAWLEAEVERERKRAPVFDAEHDRLREELARREGIPREELEDIELEGTARGWWVEARKRARFQKTEAQIQAELKDRREFLAAAREYERTKDEKRKAPAKAVEPDPGPSAEDLQKATEDVEADRVQMVRRIDDQRAAGLIRNGQLLEKTGKTKGAMDTYRRIVKEFPGSLQAKEAAARIEAMGGE